MVANIILTAGKEPLTPGKDRSQEEQETLALGVLAQANSVVQSEVNISERERMLEERLIVQMRGLLVSVLAGSSDSRAEEIRAETLKGTKFSQERRERNLRAEAWRSDIARVETLDDLRRQASLLVERVRKLSEVVPSSISLSDEELVEAMIQEGAVVTSEGGVLHLVLTGGGKGGKGKKVGRAIGKIAKEVAIRSVTAALVGSGAYTAPGSKPKRANRRAAKMGGSGAYRGQGAYRGMGAYTDDNYNSLFPEAASRSSLQVRSSQDETGIIRVSKKEYLFDVFSPAVPSAFTTNKFQANPGLGALCPFLGQIAGNYDKYRFRKLILYYEPVVTDSSSTGQMGVVLLAFNTNPAAATFATKQQMSEYDGSLSFKICESGVIGVECDSSKSAKEWLFVRSGSVPSGQDIKTYDFGSFVIGTSGISSAAFPAGTQIGEIWCEYEVELASPKLYDAMGYSNLADCFYGPGSGGLTAALPLGTTPYRSSMNSLGGSLSISTGATKYYLPDNFTGWIRVRFYVGGGTCSNGIITLAGNITGFTDMIDKTLFNVSAVNINSVAGNEFLRFSDYYVMNASSAGGNNLTLTCTMSSPSTIGWFHVEMFNSQLGVMSGVGSNFVPN